MEFIKNYWKYRRCVFGFMLLFVAVFAVAFYLYNIPVEAVVYPATVFSVLGILVLIADIYRTYRSHKRLQRLSQLTSSFITDFPKVQSQSDADYQAIIQVLIEEQQHFKADMESKYYDMTEYYTIWAHQIKTPIASMNLTLQNEDSPLSGQLSDELKRIEQYVEMVLAFLRLDAQSTDYVFKECDLDSIIKDSVKKFAGQFIRKKIRLCYEPTAGKILTDEKWLSFVIEQILSNAVKYTHSGSVTIRFEQQILSVSDTGIGIAEEDIPRIFQKSYTGYNGRSDKKASGIGLYLCKRICDNLGYEIWAESAVDVGTTVSIDLSRRESTFE